MLEQTLRYLIEWRHSQECLNHNRGRLLSQSKVHATTTGIFEALTFHHEFEALEVQTFLH